MIDLKKGDSENERQYIWRLCRAKEDGLLDIDWKGLAEILNKELRSNETEYYDESAYRKSYQYANLFYEDVFKYMLNDDLYLKELEKKKEEIKKERYKLTTINIERNRNVRLESRKELFYENIKDCFMTLPVPDYEELYDNNIITGENEYVLTIADIHAGAKFESSNNSYSLNICESRFSYLLNQTIEFIKDKKLRHLTILELGDSIQGILRMSDIKMNDSSVVEATMFVARQLSMFINNLSKYCEIDYYHTPTSNHSQIRPLGGKANEMGTEDIEYIISNYIKDTLINNDRVNVHLNPNKEYIDFSIFDYNLIAMHGHQIRNIQDSLKDLSSINRKFYDIVFLAHFHGGSETVVGECVSNDAEVLVCPAFVGSDPYGDSIFKNSKASCKIFGISEYGGHTETYKIILN